MLFLDRDGVLNENKEGSYIMSPTDLEIFEFAGPAIAKYQTACGQPVAIVSNQAGVGLGYMSLEELNQIRKPLLQNLADAGVNIKRLAVVSCTHKPSARCGCRKPKPGLIFWAKGFFGYGSNRQEDYMVGDYWTDMVAGKRADCQTILVETGRGKDPVNAKKLASYRVGDYQIQPNLADAVDYILQRYEEIMQSC